MLSDDLNLSSKLPALQFINTVVLPQIMVHWYSNSGNIAAITNWSEADEQALNYLE